MNLHTQNMGIKQETDKKAEITADRLNINVENKGRVEGIHLFGVNKRQKLLLMVTPISQLMALTIP